MAIFTPYIIFGKLLDRNGNAVGGAEIVAQNLNNGGTIIVFTETNGEFTIDCANFERGYADLDRIRLRGASGFDYDLYFSVDGGKTWIQMNNEVEVETVPNMSRVKIDSVNYPGGRDDLNITLIA